MNTSLMRLMVFILAVSGVVIFSGRADAGQEIAPKQTAQSADIDNETCFTCHGDPEGDKFFDPKEFEGSIHGQNRCTSCHNDIKEVPHDTPLKPVNCGACHRIEVEVYLNNDHGKALKEEHITEAATCKSCHGDTHTLLSSRDPQSPVYRMNIPQTCARCHENTEGMNKFDLKQNMPTISYNQSVHGLALENKKMISAAVCTDCHGSHDLHRSTNPQSKLYWQNIPRTCGKCHENIFITYMRSVHGQAMQKGEREAPVCTDCHGEHIIDAVKMASSKVYSSHISETCGQCHATERITTKYRLPDYVVNTYMNSIHGLSVQLGSLKAANCASCHGVHDILSASDPRSSVYSGNLVKTCGKCHAGVGDLVNKGQIHAGIHSEKDNNIAAIVRRVYIILIVLITSLMLVHNGLDFAQKFQARYRALKIHSQKIRMGLNERVQHAVLAVSFIILAYTGFALKFPQTWWAMPFVGRVDWRSGGHRIAAAFFIVLAAYHVGYLFLTKKGRAHLHALVLRKIDIIQAGQMIAYYLGRRKQKPIFAFYGYPEKIEYWALVWGSIIMVVTGVLMLNESWFLTHFPKWFWDVTTIFHYYEAILACVAILLWHGYFVIFDPDEYPMKMSWIDGRASHEDQKRESTEL